jgi:hypothetical protein
LGLGCSLVRRLALVWLQVSMKYWIQLYSELLKLWCRGNRFGKNPIP